MADDTTTTDDAPTGTPPAHGRAINGDTKAGKGKGILSGPHRDEILVGTAVLGTLIAWMTLRSTKHSAQAASVPASTITPTTMAGSSGTVAGSVTGSSSGDSNILNQLLSNQGQLNQTLISGLISSSGQAVTSQHTSDPATDATTTALTGISKQLAGLTQQQQQTTPQYGFDPTNSNLVRNSSTNAIYQIEPDGSMLHITPAQNAALTNPTAWVGHQYSDPTQKV